ncbi:NAD(P)-dependent oxidoreductase [Litoribrevibacter euphylliae]|uniref:NAD(P)-dependent oxidoreductase n=1 Tax=Litoribrevibacter euphylliae TaxID=1834034 RepID=A0ABV7HFF1_9GAMM
MTTLVLGANGQTGRLVVEALLERDESVIAVVRSKESLPMDVLDHALLHVVEVSITDITEAEIGFLVKEASSIVCCLGHNLSWQGLYGEPRRLVRDSVKRICSEVESRNLNGVKKFVLMNSTGCRNSDLKEQVSVAQKIVIGLLKLLLPPHADNEQAAEFLRKQIGQDNQQIEWVVVRPDGLIDENQVSGYELHPSPIRSAIFDPGKTSRINVADFMAALITDETLWQSWKGQAPVIYNEGC